MASLINRPVRPAVRQSIGPWHNSGRQHGLTCHGRVLFYSHASTCSSGSHTWRVSHLGVAAPSFCAGPLRHLPPSVLCASAQSQLMRVLPDPAKRAGTFPTPGSRQPAVGVAAEVARVDDFPRKRVCVRDCVGPRHRLCAQFCAATVILFCSQVQSANRALRRCQAVCLRSYVPYTCTTRAGGRDHNTGYPDPILELGSRHPGVQVPVLG